MSRSEAEVTPEIITAARQYYGATLLRNNSGAMKNPHGSYVRFGLGNVKKNNPFKSSDYIGVTPVVITQDMVGKTLAVFTCIELKKADWKYNEYDEREVLQKRFIDWIVDIGGFGGFAKSVSDLRGIFKIK